MIERGEHARLAFEAGEPVGLLPNSSGSVLIATSRPSVVSRAFQTSPIPPLPMAERISYWPSRAPGRIGPAILCTGTCGQTLILGDLKPANIKGRNDGTVKVLDSGSARRQTKYVVANKTRIEVC